MPLTPDLGIIPEELVAKMKEFIYESGDFSNPEERASQKANLLDAANRYIENMMAGKPLARQEKKDWIRAQDEKRYSEQKIPPVDVIRDFKIEIQNRNKGNPTLFLAIDRKALQGALKENSARAVR